MEPSALSLVSINLLWDKDNRVRKESIPFGVHLPNEKPNWLWFEDCRVCLIPVELMGKQTHFVSK